jgi:hypothetical protein
MSPDTAPVAPAQSTGRHGTAGRVGYVSGHSSRRRRVLVISIVVIVLDGATAVGVADPFAKRTPSTSGAADNADPTALQTVKRQGLSSQTELSGTLGYAGSYTVINQAAGTAGSPLRAATQQMPSRICDELRDLAPGMTFANLEPAEPRRSARCAGVPCRPHQCL